VNFDKRQILEDLNPPQREAAEFGDGPLLILAGAGSGKTKTLTHRIAYLVATGKAKPWEILAVTFTNKAAGEMRERLAKLLGQENSRGFMPWMGTFHAIAVRILRIYGENVEIPRNFVVLDEADRLSLIKNAMKSLGITDKQFNPRSIASIISTAKNDCLSPADYAAIAKMPAQKIAADVYPRYEKLRKNAKSLDFDDLLLETVKLLANVKPVREELAAKLKYILIDEYQDTNAAQYKMVKLLLGEKRNICAVGDDWQSIYSWRGADFTNILNFERDFPGAKVVKLEQNYRSTEAILNAAHNVIVKNSQRTDKKLWTAKKGGEPVQIIATRDEKNEAEIIANRIYAETAVGSRNFADFAVLYRTNAQSRILEEIFLRYNLPYKIIGGVRFYDRAEIKDLLAYLKLLYQPFDRASFERIVNVPRRSLGDVSVAKFLAWQSTRGISLIDAMNNVENCEDLTPRAKKEFAKFGAELSEIREKIDDTAPAEILDLVRKKFDYDAYLVRENPAEIAESKSENVRELAGAAETFVNLGEFLEEVALVSGADAANGENALTMMTLHAAKGLEFPAVFMVGMEEGIFPGQRAEYEPAAMEEERRLCYVGMTRAREELILTFAASRFLYGNRQYNLPSRFLGEIDADFAKNSGSARMSDDFSRDMGGSLYDFRETGLPSENAADEPRFVPDEIELFVGDRVRHRIFGAGRVVDIDGSVIAVDFGAGKVKKLNAAFAPLEKL
jgi:DNA helicase-2/ATP-dependent DNA helicase PcrA